MTPTQTSWKYLERDRTSSYRQLCIKGTAFHARSLYGRYKSAEEPATVEQVAEEYGVSIEAVREAIAYCESDPPEIRQDFAVEEALMEASGMNEPGYKYNPTPRMISPEEYARIVRTHRP